MAGCLEVSETEQLHDVSWKSRLLHCMQTRKMSLQS